MILRLASGRWRIGGEGVRGGLWVVVARGVVVVVNVEVVVRLVEVGIVVLDFHRGLGGRRCCEIGGLGRMEVGFWGRYRSLGLAESNSEMAEREVQRELIGDGLVVEVC